MFGNVRCKHWCKLGLERRLKTLERAVKPLFTFHCVAWPPQNQIAKEVDQLQRHMTAAAIGLRPSPLESAADFRRNSARECSKLIGDSWWKYYWFDSAISWRAHLVRDFERQRRFFENGVAPHLLSTVFAWAPVMYSTWSADWIEAQRFFSQNNGRQCMDSRLFRRACVGHVHRRWAQGVS